MTIAKPILQSGPVRLRRTLHVATFYRARDDVIFLRAVLPFRFCFGVAFTADAELP